VATWGPGLAADWSSDAPGRLVSINLEDRSRQILTPDRIGNFDGLERFGPDQYLVSDWVAGTIDLINPNEGATAIVTGLSGAADIGFVSGSNMIEHAGHPLHENKRDPGILPRRTRRILMCEERRFQSTTLLRWSRKL